MTWNAPERRGSGGRGNRVRRRREDAEEDADEDADEDERRGGRDVLGTEEVGNASSSCVFVLARRPRRVVVAVVVVVVAAVELDCRRG